MDEVDPFAREAVNQITPENIRKLWYLTITMAVTVTIFVTGSVWNDARDKERHDELRETVEELSEVVGMISDNYIRLDAEVKKNQEISDLRHLQ